MFYYIYLILVAVIYIATLPFLAILAFRKKYRDSIPSRFFLINNLPLKENGLHFHTCSYGEAKAIKAVIDEFDSEILRFSTTTQTGFSVIKNYTSESRYLPFELFLPFWIKRQKLLVVFEAELWYMLFAVSKRKGTKTFLINARLSEKSFPKYYRFKWLYKRVFENVDAVYAQSFEDAKRLKRIGAKNISVIGNIKFANTQKPTKVFPKNYKLIVTAGSTHEGEEKLILDAFLSLKEVENAQLIVTPRHPERFNSVAAFLEKEALKENLTFSRYSKCKDFKSDIVLIDVMGELINSYAISDIVILGGAFADIGGHNALEAAQFGVKIITGKNYYNQVEIFKHINGLTIIEPSILKETLLNYMALPYSSVDTKSNLSKLVKDIKDVL